MIKRLLALLLPASVVAGGVAAGGYARKAGMIPPPVWDYLWPSLVAVGFAAFAVALFMMGLKKWAIPPATGFLVQVVGIIMMWAGSVDGPWDVLWITLPAVGLALLVLGIVWLVVTLRARWLEQKMLQGVGGDGGIDQQELVKIRKGMNDAIQLMQRAGRGRNAIYELPWFLVIGRPQAGKTIAIKNSGLSLPVRKDWVKGVGGTHTCDWFFTNELIFLDTPGKWVIEGAGEEGSRYWVELLRLLRRYRGRRPLDGLVVTVPADDLLGKTDAELQEQASNIREVIDLLQGELSFRFPVYLLISKCDLVEGFVDFFKGLPAQRRHEILGWSNEDPNAGDARRLVGAGFRRLVRRLDTYRLEMLARVARKTQARRLFFFTEEFRRMAKPLQTVADVLFGDDPASQSPVFRGFYFTSGTQGEGSPLGSALSDLAQNLGVRVGGQAPAAEEEPKRSYFLLELFRNLMVGDEGLVDRTAVHWWRRRRDTMMVAFLPAGVAVFGLILATLSYTLNLGVYRQVEEEAPRIATELAGYRNEPTGDSISEALDRTEKLRGFHKDLAGFTMLRRFGMRRPGPLRLDTIELFRTEFVETVLNPTLRMAQEVATDPSQACVDRMDVFYSVIWLRQGHRGEWSEDLKGLDLAWGVPPAAADEARHKLVRQFAYLKENSSDGLAWLTAINLGEMARSIKEDCSSDAAVSSLGLYQSFQQACAEPQRTCEITDCYMRLRKALDFQVKDYGRLRDHIDALKDDLRTLKQEPGAARALELFKDIHLAESDTSECVKEFNEQILPAMAAYSDQKSLIESCNEEWVSSGRKRTLALNIVREQGKELEKGEEARRNLMRNFNSMCGGKGFPRLEPRVLFETNTAYRRVACVGENEPCGAARTAPPRPKMAADPDAPPAAAVPARERKPSASPPRAQARPAGLRWLESARKPDYSSDGWATRKATWEDDVAYARELSGGEREAELRRIGGEVDAYASQYAGAWQDYLESIRLKSNALPVPSWLEELASTPEFQSLLAPAAAALKAGSEATQPPFDSMSLKLQSLGDVQRFVGTSLADYQEKLRNTAAELKRCAEDRAYWASFRAGLSSGSPSNSLVEARSWVERNAGPAIARGALREQLLKPLAEAESFIQGGSLTAAQWASLREIYSAVASKFPFAGDPVADPAEPTKVSELLGCKGAARDLHVATARLDLSASARQWLEEAAGISRALFGEGPDDAEALRMRLTIGDVTIEPADLAKDFRLDEMHLYLGGGVEKKWKPDDLKEVRVEVDLVGKDASQESLLTLAVGERKGMMGRTFGGNWKPGEPAPAARAEGPWAPLKLLVAGLPPGVAPGNDSLNLVYSIEIPYKKNNPGHVKVSIRVEAKGIGRLLALMDKGLPPPPALAGGE